MTTKKTNTHPHSAAEDIAASLKLVEDAAQPFANVVRMTTIEKQRAAKLQRGAHQVLPLIAQLARKFAVTAPGTSVDDIVSNIDYAQSLEPLLGAVASLHETLRDAHLHAQTLAWGTGRVTYAMMKTASKANVTLADALAPVTKWFRQRARGTAAVTPPVATTSAPETLPAVAPSAPAAKPNGAAISAAN